LPHGHRHHQHRRRGERGEYPRLFFNISSH
jgi:hypothetical protein